MSEEISGRYGPLKISLTLSVGVMEPFDMDGAVASSDDPFLSLASSVEGRRLRISPTKIVAYVMEL
jgi:hypothetical protein